MTRRTLLFIHLSILRFAVSILGFIGIWYKCIHLAMTSIHLPRTFLSDFDVDDSPYQNDS